MNPRVIASVAAGLALYLALVAILYGLNRLAAPAAGAQFPVWYSASELLLKALTAVGPGFAAGWLFRSAGLVTGAVAGVGGGAVEVVVLAALDRVPFSEFGARIAVGAIANAVAGALTNAAGGLAGESLGRRDNLSSPPPGTEVRRHRRWRRKKSG